MSWIDMIINSMEKLGGHAEYKDLYDMIEDLYPEKTSSVKDYKAQVRGTIERFSSDSDVFYKKKSKKDIFYLVGEKGDGHWGIRNFEPHDNDVDMTEDDQGFPEGKKMLRAHICRERNYKIIKEAKSKYKAENGRLICEICEFDFEKTYGEIGKDFIEGHHIRPISELNENDKTEIKDIIMVCSNCHKMLHRKRPWLKAEELIDKLLK
ncbi:HNH endonuclease [Peptostreptococcus canis]|uniref:Restriction endonuclease n=1 Tax=Peptostreptococcus canis TaxID=1159213 RepID=A0ABR6TJF5_9FIRM|nr:HNH endonuclease [Peptostreptococcus canis]MBC2575551.1 restriction endonuclease [Peptostreptococcus canis]MBP1997254.1 putative restriction endonuclease [Peptostreptococcus canis]